MDEPSWTMQALHTRFSVREREREVLRTLIQENLFPAVVKGLFRVFVLAAFIDGCERGDLLHTNPVRNKNRPKEFRVEPTSASRKRISDLRLPFLIEPGREVSIDLKSKKKW